MHSKVRRIINSLTSDIITTFNIEIPISNMDEIVTSLGGKIELGQSFSDGEVRKDGDNFIIILSPFQDEKRMRFMIAHELGHLFLHMGYKINRELWDKQETGTSIYFGEGSSEQEYQANEFAAALLMPEKEYIEIMNENTEGNKVNTSKIAEYFKVSVEAASNRGKFLGYLNW